ncbi:hypothetical protein niasHS_012141 [Heterodera schachtii]|uniref:UV-stimulated scaffold protein A C-terminal domain-containing protein n=1 Tax=Heterodera schachtii TaxID=97005 RepID=A0ABD2IDD3_HETSC
METDLTTIKRSVAHLIKEFDYQKKELKGAPLKELVSVVKSNGKIIPAFVDTLFGHLRRDDSDVRLAALFIANHFFQRSHNFRAELTNSIQDFLIYTLEIDPLRYPLPKPSEAANLLKKESLATLRCWVDKFGAGYGKLEKLQHFLKNSKSIDWENSRVELSIDRERESREQFQREINARKVTENVSKLFGESRPEIERLLVESRNVVEMIFPKFCPLDGEKGAVSIISSQNQNEQLHGFGPSSAVTISINPTESNIEQNYENEALFSQLTDTTAQLEIWWSKLGKWLKKLASVGDSSEMMRRIIDAKRNLGEDLQKCRELKGKRKTEGDESSADEGDDDSDLVDVEEKEGYEPDFSHNDCIKSSDKIAKCAIILDERPGPSGLKVRKEKPKEDEEKGGKSDEINGKKRIPKLAMGLDLKYWGEEHIKPAERVRVQAEGHHFWRPMDEDADNVPTENAEAYRSRQITFVGQMLPIKKRCRAPLPSGKLCPRMERERCALHGPIIDRDEMGFPQKEQKDEDEHLQNSTDEADEQREESEEEFLQDLEEATGAKLTENSKKVKKKATKRRKKKTTTKKKKGKKKKKKTARERPKPKSEKSRERLVAKLFDKKTLKRVAKTLEQMQKARANRKFSGQFNYALERR